MEFDQRPWGNYQVLADEPDHKVKRIVVYPGKRLSLQRHRQRAEHWYLIAGQGLVTRDREEISLVRRGGGGYPPGGETSYRKPRAAGGGFY